jgi:ribosomal protein RSM22 (predicted rRNA methylase)
MSSSNSAPRPQPATSASQWQLAHDQAAVEWMHSSGVAQRMLTDICTAVEKTVDWLIQDDTHRARWVIQQFPGVLTCCDVLQFNDPAQALAYLVLHLPDRYCRMFQVLERLLQSGRLPVGRRRELAAFDDFAVMDIGAGPGPAIFAIRSFYAALAHYSTLHDPPGHIATLGHATIVERSRAMPYIVRRFAEALTFVVSTPAESWFWHTFRGS